MRQDKYKSTVILGESNLTVNDVISVSKYKAKVILKISDQAAARIETSHRYIQDALHNSELIYGVNTNFGGMAKSLITDEQECLQLQENLLRGLNCGVGKTIPLSQVRAAMLIRAKSLLFGVSGIRLELIERLIRFINTQATPIVHEYGSIGASGDLVPLAYIANAITGINSESKVSYHGDICSAATVLKDLKLSPIDLKPKEGLALVNGTSMMTAVAAESICDAEELFRLTLSVHACYAQALGGSSQAYDSSVHKFKPHLGQIAVARMFRQLLAGSQFIRNNISQSVDTTTTKLIQDRYSLRCIPQFLGPVHDGLLLIKQQIETEINSVTDNPLIDVSKSKILHSGNFLGEYISVGMDQLRQFFALMAKHLDVQIALLVTPELNNCLPSSLVYSGDKKNCFGLKGLQICANSIMPTLLYYADPMATRFPTHAEQFNQNINSLGLSSANLTWRTLGIFKNYLAVCLIFAIQALELKSSAEYHSFDPRNFISKLTLPLYESVYEVLQVKPSSDRPLIYENNTDFLDNYINKLAKDLNDNKSLILNQGLDHVKFT